MNTVSFFFHTMRTRSVVLFGVVFFVFHLSTSYSLYHVNTYKLWLLSILVSIVWLYSLVFPPKANRQIAAWQVGLFLLLPCLATFPGTWFNPEDNVYFPIELVTDLLCVSWVVLIVRMLQTPHDCLGFMQWIGTVIIVISLILAWQYWGYNQATGAFAIYPRPEGTFGNVNYLAGFLAVLTPVFVLVSMPQHKDKWLWPVHSRFFALVSCALCVSLYFTQTRAAIVATVMATIGAFILIGLINNNRNIRLLSIVVVVVGVALAAILIVLPFFLPDIVTYYPQRFALLYDLSNWLGRTVPVRGAIDSIAASPFIGHGLGASYNLNFEFLPQDADLFLANNSYNHLHNEWLEYMQEGGVLGLITLFVVYGVFVVKLLRYASRQHNHFASMIAIGVIGGLAAFYAHGVFSVAQRMIVANSALFTILGLGCVLLVHERQGDPWMKSWRVVRWSQEMFVRYRFAPVASAFLCMLALWLVFMPWLQSYKGMVDLNNKRASISDRIAFYDEHPNPYGMSDLLNQLISRKQYSTALTLAQKLDAIIPNYRNLSYRIASIYFAMGDDDKALYYATQQQKFSQYMPANNVLLLVLAQSRGDKEAVKLYVKKLFVHAMLSADLQDSLSKPDQITFRTDTAHITFSADSDSVEIGIPDEMIDAMITLSSSPDTFRAFVDDLASKLSMQPAITPRVAKMRELVTTTNAYFGIEKKHHQRIAKQKRTYSMLTRYKEPGILRSRSDRGRINHQVATETAQERQKLRKELSQLLEGSSLSLQDFLARVQMFHTFTSVIRSTSEMIKTRANT